LFVVCCLLASGRAQYKCSAVGFLQDAYDVIAAVGLLLGVRHYDVISLLDDVIMYCTCM
jgi:hypothetical protein